MSVVHHGDNDIFRKLRKNTTILETVLKIQVGRRTILLFGDSQQQRGQALLSECEADANARIRSTSKERRSVTVSTLAN